MHKRRATASLEQITIEIMNDTSDTVDGISAKLADTKIDEEPFYSRTLPLKLTWAKCAKCSVRIITVNRCDTMACSCVFCPDCIFQQKYCPIHHKISVSDNHWYRNPANSYDMHIYNTIDLPIHEIASKIPPEDVAALRKAKSLSSNVIDYALFYKEEETYAAARNIVKQIAKTGFAFGLDHVEINSAQLANIHFLYQMLKRAHIYIVADRQISAFDTCC